MTAYTGQTWTTLGQLCAALWDSHHSWLRYSLDSNQGVCSDASRTETQCLRLLRHSGAPITLIVRPEDRLDSVFVCMQYS